METVQKCNGCKSEVSLSNNVDVNYNFIWLMFETWPFSV